MASRDLDISYRSIQKIVIKYKFNLFQRMSLIKLRTEDYVSRINFCEQFLLEIQDDQHFGKIVIWTTKATFCQQKLSMRKISIFGERKSARYFEGRPIVQIQKYFVMSFNGWQGRIFLYEVNLNSGRYQRIIRNVVVNFLDHLSLDQTFDNFYRMDASAHSSREVDQ